MRKLIQVLLILAMLLGGLSPLVTATGTGCNENNCGSDTPTINTNINDIDISVEAIGFKLSQTTINNYYIIDGKIVPGYQGTGTVGEKHHVYFNDKGQWKQIPIYDCQPLNLTGPCTLNINPVPYPYLALNPTTQQPYE